MNNKHIKIKEAGSSSEQSTSGQKTEHTMNTNTNSKTEHNELPIVVAKPVEGTPDVQVFFPRGEVTNYRQRMRTMNEWIENHFDAWETPFHIEFAPLVKQVMFWF